MPLGAPDESFDLILRLCHDSKGMTAEPRV